MSRRIQNPALDPGSDHNLRAVGEISRFISEFVSSHFHEQAYQPRSENNHPSMMQGWVGEARRIVDRADNIYLARALWSEINSALAYSEKEDTKIGDKKHSFVTKALRHLAIGTAISFNNTYRLGFEVDKLNSPDQSLRQEFYGTLQSEFEKRSSPRRVSRNCPVPTGANSGR